MYYRSTRDSTVKLTSAQAIIQGLSQDGGLFVPEEIPQPGPEFFASLGGLSYVEKACKILPLFLTDFTPEEIRFCVEGAYGPQFDDEAIAPLARLDDSLYLLELWHGPTCAFKDMALQLLPRLMTVAAAKTGEQRTIAVLVATSGDTGKAALEGFRDVPGTSMTVFYPQSGVSPMQKLQMTTQEGSNVYVCGIDGNFDDAQNGVKAIFSSKELAGELNEKNILLSSANSINWGRLVPQIVYYVSAYCDLLADGEIAQGESINVAVPTGNFGNILAAYYAKKMGVPIAKLVCASNQNNVLTDFLATGVYDRNRPFYTTQSPSMDILISSNLERLLYDLQGPTGDLMAHLTAEGRYEVDSSVKEAMSGLLAGGWCADEQARQVIARFQNSCGYLMDTHTAVAVAVYQDYVAKTGDRTKTVVASTASPFKFAQSVLEALCPSACDGRDEFALMEDLACRSLCPVPAPLADLREKTVRFKDTCTPAQMSQVVRDTLERLR